MKTIAILSFLLLANFTFAQTKFPTFLEGTWKADQAEIYEHWDLLNPNALKGYSYQIQDGETLMNEYLDLTQKGKTITYTATVIKQNDGKPIVFKATRTDSVFTFENKSHNPNKVQYTRLSDNEVFVQVIGPDWMAEYTMHKLPKTVIKTENVTKSPELKTNPNYDAELAEKLAGDDYGMKHYMLVILKTGENKTTDKPYIDSCFMGHMANMDVMVKANQLVVAGPFGKNDKTFRGLFILNVTTVEEAQEILKTDPAVNAKLLDYELVPWYGSAALATYLDDVDKIWRKKF